MPDGASPVFVAAQNGHAKAILALKAAGANMDAQLSDGVTPVSTAAQCGHAEAIRALKAAGANVDALQHRMVHDSGLLLQLNDGRVEAIRALIAAGAKVDTPMLCGATQCIPQPNRDMQKQ